MSADLADRADGGVYEVDDDLTAPTLSSPWPGRELARVRRTVVGAATLALSLLLAVQWLFMVALGLPETTVLPARTWWLHQLDPLAWPVHPLTTTLLVACSAASAVLVRRGHGLVRVWWIAPAGVGSVVAVGVLVGCVARGLAGSMLAVLLLLVWLGSTGWACAHAVLAGLPERRPVTNRSGSLLLAAWLLLLPGPLALGRWLLGGPLVDEATALASNSEGLRFAALLCSASVRLWLFGALLGVLVFLAYRCWPRPDHPPGWSRWRSYAALVLTLAVVGELWWTGQSVAERRVTELRYAAPGDYLHLVCASWVYPPGADEPALTPTQTVAVTGPGCRRVTVYAGYHQLGTVALGTTVSPVALRAPAVDGAVPSEEETDPLDPLRPRTTAAPAGEPRPLVGARYGDVVVLAGSDRIDRTADQVVAVAVRGGEPLWHFTCGRKHEVRATFAGGQTDPSSEAQVPGDPGDAVVLTCAGERLRLDPVTGLTAAR